jgi:hypothetical protein
MPSRDKAGAETVDPAGVGLGGGVVIIGKCYLVSQMAQNEVASHAKEMKQWFGAGFAIARLGNDADCNII